MALETANYIPELVPSNPAGTDPKSQGDDHIRLTKLAVSQSFPGFVGTTATPKSVTLTEDQINDAALKSEAQTITGSWVLANANYLKGRDFGDANDVNMLGIDNSDVVNVGSVGFDTLIAALANLVVTIGPEEVARLVDRTKGSLLFTDNLGDSTKVGAGDPYETPVTASRNASQDDERRILSINDTGITFTLPSLAPRTNFLIKARAAGFTLAPDAGISINFFDGRGNTQPVGQRTILRSGVVEVSYQTGTSVDIWGAGIT